MDNHEKNLIDQYNEALDELRKIPKGDPRHIPVARRLVNARRALEKYQRSKNN